MSSQPPLLCGVVEISTDVEAQVLARSGVWGRGMGSRREPTRTPGKSVEKRIQKTGRETGNEAGSDAGFRGGFGVASTISECDCARR